MARNFPKYVFSLFFILLGVANQTRANIAVHLPAIHTTNTVNADHTVVVTPEQRLFIVRPYTPQLEKHVNIEVTNIEDEDEDELNHNDKENFNKNYIELDQFYSSLRDLVFAERIPSSFASRTFSPLSQRPLNIAFCVFRI